MKTIRLIIFLLPLFAFTQQQKILAKFIITDASLNKEDVTETYLTAGGYIVFYLNQEGNLYMANVMSKRETQSFGRLYSTNHNRTRETSEKYEGDIFHFYWRYVNDYDSNKGTAQVELIKIYKPQGTTFICTIIPENLDVLEYKGFMAGSIDFSKF